MSAEETAVRGWLAKKGLEELTPAFVSKEYCDVALMNEIGLDDDDLDHLEISDPTHRAILQGKQAAASEKPAAPKPAPTAVKPVALPKKRPGKMTAAQQQAMEDALGMSRGVTPDRKTEQQKPVSFPGLPSEENIFEPAAAEQGQSAAKSDKGDEYDSEDFQDDWFVDRAEWVAYREIAKRLIDNETFYSLHKECDAKYCDRLCVSQIDHAKIFTPEDWRALSEHDWHILGVKDPKAKRLLTGSDLEICAVLEAMEISKPRKKEGEQCVRCDKYLTLYEPVVECMVCDDIPVFCYACGKQDLRTAQQERKAKKEKLPEWIEAHLTMNPAVAAANRCDPEHQKQRFTNLTKRDEVHALAAFEDLSDGSVDGQTQIDNYFSLMRNDGKLVVSDLIKQVFQRMEYGNLRHNCNEDLFVEKMCAMRKQKWYSPRQRFVLKQLIHYKKRYDEEKIEKTAAKEAAVAAAAAAKEAAANAAKDLPVLCDAAKDRPEAGDVMYKGQHVVNSDSAWAGVD